MEVAPAALRDARSRWLTRVNDARRVLRAPRSRIRTLRLSLAAALLIDTVYSNEATSFAERATITDRYLAFARGRAAIIASDETAAWEWFSIAQGLTDVSDELLAARIGFELGCLALGRAQVDTASRIISWTEGSLAIADAADLLHLRALVAEARGDAESAEQLYRQSLATNARSFTPLTRALALRNLAAMVVQSDPAESVPLHRIAISTIMAQRLARSSLAATKNCLSYALASIGDTAAARREAQAASALARQSGRLLNELYADFNLAIAHELRGELQIASEVIDRVLDRARTAGFAELTMWAMLRSCWLKLRAHDVEAVRIALERIGNVDTPFADTVATLRTFLLLSSGRAFAAQMQFSRRASDYARRNDQGTAFVLYLWAAVAAEQAGNLAAAHRAAVKACEIGGRSALRVATSWWSAELAVTVKRLLPDQAHYVAGWHPAAGALSRATARVEVHRDGHVFVNSWPLADAEWSSRRIGTRVLQRYFRELVSAYPDGRASSDLADRFWPETDGDRAAANLKAAAKELRRALAAVPGLQLSATGGQHRLVAHDNVRIL